MPFAVQVNVSMLDALSPKLKTMQRRFAQLSSVVDRSEEKMKKFGAAARTVGTRLSIGATLPILGLGVASIKAASDAEEAEQKFGVVFRDISDAAESSASNLANNFGLSKIASKELLAGTGDLLTGFGFTQASALSLSNQVQELAVDLASFTNVEGGAERASIALTKALLGERESVKELGIAILEEDVKAKVAALEVAGRFIDETERERKAIATLAIALEQSKNAIGDFARSSSSFANQLRILQARASDLIKSFGDELLPMATKVAGIFISIAKNLTSLSPTMKKIIIIVGILTASLGPMILSIAGAVFVLGLFTTANLAAAASALAAIPAFVAMGVAAIGSLAPFIPIILVVGVALLALAALIFKFWKPIQSFLSGVWEGFIVGFEPVLEVFRTVGQIASAAFGLLGLLFGDMNDQTEESADGFKTFGKIVGFIMGIVADVILLPIAKIGLLIKGIKFVLKLIPGVNQLIDAFALDTEGIEAEAARPAAGFTNPLVGKPGGTQVNQNINITAQFDSAGNLVGATANSDSAGETKIETFNLGRITPVIL